MREYLIEGINKIGIKYTDKKIDDLINYLNLLVNYNSHTNLTAIRDEEGILEKHFLDSLLVQEFIPSGAKKIIDIGTGAGFPGMVLAIINPEIKFTLMDSIGKKTKFLELVKEELNLENVEVVTARAEEFINEENRETYDIGLCRGVSKLNTILEYMIPFLKVDGIFLSQKMEGTGEEQEAQNALSILNSHIGQVHTLKLPYCGDQRLIVEVIKDKTTDKKYPRRTGMALKKPL